MRSIRRGVDLKFCLTAFAGAMLSVIRRGRITRHLPTGLLRQCCSVSASCAGLQSRQLHTDVGIAGGGQALVAD